MKRISFLAFLASFIPVSLFAKKANEEKKYKEPVEPIAALKEIFQGLAKEFGVKIESNTISSDSDSRTDQTFRLPGLYAQKEWWVCLSTERLNLSGICHISEQTLTRVQLCLYTFNKVHQGVMQIILEDPCGDGGFGVRVGIRTHISKNTREEELFFMNVDTHRCVSGSRILHPLHRRIIPLFEEMTSGGDV